MDIKDLLVCLDATDAGTRRLALAAHIARGHKARLSAAAIVPEERVASQSYGPGGLGLGVELGTGIPEAGIFPDVPAPDATPPEEREATLAEILEERFRDALQPHGIEGDWHVLVPDDTAALTELAKSVDLTILGQVSSEDRLGATFPPEEIALACGRPLLVIPYAGAFASVGKRVLIAWDGSREAVRAVNDALPLMAGAETVTVLVIGANEHDLERHRTSLARIVRHLVAHGLPARPSESLRGGIPNSDVLLSRAADLSADLIVAGLYHHSRLREALLGGVSRELLQHMTVPVLMSH